MMSLSTPAHADPVVLQIGSPLVGPEHASSKAMEIFRTELARRTQGALGVAFPVEMKDGGSVRELVDSVHTGAIFALPCPIPYLSRLVPEIEALGLPFVFRDADHAHRIVDGPAGKLIEARLNAKGFVPLTWMELGVRQVTNAKRPLKTLEDFKGLRIRVQPSETHMAIFRALGANPVAMDYGSVYTALKQGDIDAVESPYYPTYAPSCTRSKNIFPTPDTSSSSWSSLPTGRRSPPFRRNSRRRSGTPLGSQPLRNGRWWPSRMARLWRL
jgi:TRAP-type C4-dicarboxylate transport system substrate-binding protein